MLEPVSFRNCIETPVTVLHKKVVFLRMADVFFKLFIVEAFLYLENRTLPEDEMDPLLLKAPAQGGRIPEFFLECIECGLIAPGLKDKRGKTEAVTLRITDEFLNILITCPSVGTCPRGENPVRHTADFTGQLCDCITGFSVCGLHIIS